MMLIKIILTLLIVINSAFAMEKPTEHEDISRLMKENERLKGALREQAIMAEKFSGEAAEFWKYKPQKLLSLEVIKNKFPHLFSEVPVVYQPVLLEYAEFKYGNKALNELEEIYKGGEIEIRKFKWKALGTYFGFSTYFVPSQNYFYFNQPDYNRVLLKGVRYEEMLPDYLTAKVHHLELYNQLKKLEGSISKRKENQQLYQQLINQGKALSKEQQEARKAVANDLELLNKQYNNLAPKVVAAFDEKEKVLNILVQNYKIHLMPVGDPTPIILKLITGLQKDPELQKLIWLFKVSPLLEYKFGGIVYARIVIYISSGKENAQKALNKVYALFKDENGLNETPRYNAKVTNLIYVAQGDGDFKTDEYARYYEPGRAYYAPYITGKYQNYHLVHPV